MKFSSFEIRNFKGIKNIELDLEKSPHGSIFPLVGINESGKTTLLEAINSFLPYESEDIALKRIFKEKFLSEEIHDLVPIGKKANFNGGISVKTFLKLSGNDKDKIKSFCKDSIRFDLDIQKFEDSFSIKRLHNFENSNHLKNSNLWDIQIHGRFIRGGKKSRRLLAVGKDRAKWLKVINFIEEMVPSVLYFPTFLFEFPEKIFLGKTPNEEISNSFFRTIIQDILDSMGTNLTISEHLIERARSRSKEDKDILKALLNEMSNKVSKLMFEGWSEIIGHTGNLKEIKIDLDGSTKKGKKHFYLTFSIRDGGLIYSIKERSLGFRWFFCFLLFTHVRDFISDKKGYLFLFDEPASNLHSSAQKHLLKCFESIAENGHQIIYSTHSQHLITPKWLENTFIVKDETQSLDEDGMYTYLKKETDINIQRYRNFASSNPSETTYFQPILDVLGYQPCELENIPDVVMLEGKYDYFYLKYFCEVGFSGLGGLNFLPGVGAQKLGPLISLYLAWGKKFIIILDSDSVGKSQKKKYIDDYFLSSSIVLTLEDIDPKWKSRKFEKLFTPSAIKGIENNYFPNKGKKKLSKTQLARVVQEMLLEKKPWTYCDETKDNFLKIAEHSKTLISS
jgi:ABC-type Mn2+/Zn2+ transport system ATPase subunit